jgi:hypothetical protein
MRLLSRRNFGRNFRDLKKICIPGFPCRFMYLIDELKEIVCFLGEKKESQGGI